MDEQSYPHIRAKLMLTLKWRRGRSIYSLSHEGVSEGRRGTWASGPIFVRTQASDVRWVSDVRRLGTVRTSGRARVSVESALSWARRTSGGGRSSGAS